MKTHASKPCCAACAATALARFPVEEQPTVSNPNQRAAASAAPTTRSFNERERKHTASFFRYRSLMPYFAASFLDRTRCVTPVAVGATKSSLSGRSSEYRHILNAREERFSRLAIFFSES